MPQHESANNMSRKTHEENQKTIFDKIQKCQQEISDYRHRCDRDILSIEKKFAKAVAPCIQERNSFIEGIPSFWSNVLLNHPLLTTMFEPGEKDVLKYLSYVDIEDLDENPDYFKIHFFFEPNPYFENRVLTKQFTEDGSASTTIKWKSNLTFPNSSKHEVWEYDELGLELKGFFRWFSDPEEQFCDPIADILKCHIWYDPLEFYFENTFEDLRDTSGKYPSR